MRARSRVPTPGGESSCSVPSSVHSSIDSDRQAGDQQDEVDGSEREREQQVGEAAGRPAIDEAAHSRRDAIPPCGFAGGERPGQTGAAVRTGAFGGSERLQGLESRPLDPFTLIVAGGLGALIAVLVLIGLLYPGSGADVLDWKPTRSAALEAENELDDVSQMIAAQNEMRRRRGAAERTEADVKAAVARDADELAARAAAYAAERAASGRPMDKRDI